MSTPVQLAASRLLASNTPVIPLNHGKACRLHKWPEKAFAIGDFQAGYNIGLRLEEGYVDVDLDSREGSALAKHFLPPTATFGHTGRTTHALYRLSDPTSCDGRIDLAGLGRRGYNVKLDLRCTEYGKKAKFYTMVPPSVHPDTHQTLEWLTQPENPSSISWAELTSRFFTLAVASEFLRLYNLLDGLSGHHSFGLFVAGAMRSCEWPQELAQDVFDAVMAEAAEPDLEDRLGALRSSYDADDGHRTGIPTLVNALDRIDPLSRFVELLQHPGLPFAATITKGMSSASKSAAVAPLLDLADGLQLDALEDYQLAQLMHSMTDGLVRHQKKWYERMPHGNEWRELRDPPIDRVIAVAASLR